MIFSLHFALIMAGYSAVGLLLGSYMIHYAGASELDLGFIFMIQPLAVFARPLICARADRFQSHKSLLTSCLLGYSMSYIPFVVIPFLLEEPKFGEILSQRIRFWILVLCHLSGSLFFCGIRSLGDALAVNHAKRVKSNFTMYRKYGAISFGTCGFLLGRVNQNWILPNFVPTHIVNVFAISLLSILVYLWPDEYFVMQTDKSKEFQGLSTDSKQPEDEESTTHELITGYKLFAHVLRKLQRTIFFCCPSSTKEGKSQNEISAGSNQIEHPTTSRLSCSSNKSKCLNVRQQVAIFWLLIKRDIRIPLFMLLLLYGGMVGYAPPNFVFTYMNEFCHEKGVCDAASLAGLVMISYCICETICYFIIKALSAKINYVILLEITLVSLAGHYYFYGFLLPHLSPYFFLVESLHGLEYSSSLTACVELAYRFANQVELLVPELIERKIIKQDDDMELVKLSLMATMSACFTLVYDGFGTIIGSLIFGLTSEYYSYTFTWKLIGTLATIGFFSVIVVVSVGKCFGIKPKIFELAESKTDRNDTRQNDYGTLNHDNSTSGPLAMT